MLYASFLNLSPKNETQTNPLSYIRKPTAESCLEIGSDGRVARLSSAKAATAVRIRFGPRRLNGKPRCQCDSGASSFLSAYQSAYGLTIFITNLILALSSPLYLWTQQDRSRTPNPDLVK